MDKIIECFAYISLHDSKIIKIIESKENLELFFDGIFLEKEHPKNPFKQFIFAFPAKADIYHGKILKAVIEERDFKNIINKININKWNFEIITGLILYETVLKIDGWWWKEEVHYEGEIFFSIPESIKFKWEHCVKEG